VLDMGMEKYLRTESEPVKNLPLPIRLADEKVPIESVLSLLGVDVPENAVSWKVYCPFGDEHFDSGQSKAMRVYSETNSCMCFAMHGSMGPTRLWAYHTRKRPVWAAEDLLARFGIRTTPKPYWERMRELRNKVEPVLDRDALWQAMMTKLESCPEYQRHQYDTEVLRVVNWIQSKMNSLDDDISSEELETWYSEQMEVVEKLVAFLNSRSG